MMMVVMPAQIGFVYLQLLIGVIALVTYQPTVQGHKNTGHGVLPP